MIEIPRYSQNESFENRAHIVWEIGYCGRAGEVFVILALVFAITGVVADLLNMKLGLTSTSWLLLALVFIIGGLFPALHMLTAKHLLGMDLIKKE